MEVLMPLVNVKPTFVFSRLRPDLRASRLLLTARSLARHHDQIEQERPTDALIDQSKAPNRL
jgi:hypothetical protein